MFIETTTMVHDIDKKICVITGANSGVGFALADRILATHPGITLCMICRDNSKGRVARDNLLLAHPGARVDLVLMDVGCIKSVQQGAQDLKAMYEHIDLLYLNAGVMPSPRVNYLAVLTSFFQPSKFVHRFSTGADLLGFTDSTTSEGFKLTFATNVLGHFCLVQELLETLGGDRLSQIIWTSSRNASPTAFHIDDIQHKIGLDPYSSSKYLTDALSVAMNHVFRPKNIYVHTTCPGLVASNLTAGILPWYIWYCLSPIIKGLRYFVPSMTWNPHNGAEALVWLSTQDPSKLDPSVKFFSAVTAMGVPYTTHAKMDISTEVSDQALDQLKRLLLSL